MEDSQFLKDHLNAVLPQNPQQEPERQDSQQELNEEIPLLAIQETELLQEQPQLPLFIASMKKSITEDTEQPTDLKALFQPNPGEGERTKHLTLDQIYTNLVLHPGRAKYVFTEDRQQQLKEYPKKRENLKPKGQKILLMLKTRTIAKGNANAGFKNSEEEKMPLSALYEKVVSGKLLRGATVLTSTRPGSAVSSVANLPFDRTFEILGFTSEQVEEYVQRFTANDKIAREKIWNISAAT
ncbi:NLR, CARD domain containing 5 [Desmophyllum pertusum]|uniref:NLR, CARD domain containing 5 n=1 Tax=Desmophyllum pertusum TaxID=174260 RepID=A0A9W9Z7U3_9CNID|nr:NLR, CARD domain containing 5 [Desmophyllum pertusum]